MKTPVLSTTKMLLPSALVTFALLSDSTWAYYAGSVFSVWAAFIAFVSFLVLGISKSFPDDISTERIKGLVKRSTWVKWSFRGFNLYQLVAVMVMGWWFTAMFLSMGWYFSWEARQNFIDEFKIRNTNDT